MSLTERRKADRIRMAGLLVPVVIANGATAEIENVGPEIWVRIKAARGLSLTVTLDGKSPQPDVHVLSWHGVEAPHKLAPHFAPSVNNYHWHKATDIAEGFDALCAVITKRLQSAQDGSAFQ